MSATTESSSHSDDSPLEAPEARDYFWSAWELFRRDPFVLALRIGVDLVRWGLYLVGVTWIGALLASQWSALRATGMSSPAILQHFVRDVRSPEFIVGGTVLMGTLGLTSLALDALVSAGIWHTIASGVRDEPVEWLRTSLRGAARGFPDVALLRLLSSVAQWTVAILGLTLAVGLVAGFRQSFGTDSLGLQVIALAVPLFLYAIFAALVRLTFEVASAPMFVAGRSAGEAVGEAANFAIHHFGPLYRLVVFALGLFLIPLVGYWAVLMGQNLLGGSTRLALVFGGLRVVAELALALSTGFFSILFYGALFTYYAHSTGRLERLPRRWTDRSSERNEPSSRQRTSSSSVETSSSQDSGEGNASSAYEGDETLYDLLPLMQDHVVSSRAIPGLDWDDPDEGGSPPDDPSSDDSTDRSS